MSYQVPWLIYVVRGFIWVTWAGMLAFLGTRFGVGAFYAGMAILLCGAFDMALKWSIKEKREEYEGTKDPPKDSSGSCLPSVLLMALIFVGGILGAYLLVQAVVS